jgi:MoaA/NifB/PqqE/SkfB family radical SAM enzyme
MTIAPRLPVLELNETPAFPRCIEIQTTNICNARCGVCPYPTTTALESKGFMEDAVIARVLAECAEHRDEMEFVIPYFNNEPFADRRMLDILRTIARDVRVPVELSTNASILDEPRARAVLSEGLVHVLRISLFGTEQDTYERRMKNLRWRQTSENIRKLLELRSELGSSMSVELIMVGAPEVHRAEVALARSLWEPLGASVRIFGYLDRAGNNDDRNLLPLSQRWGRLRGCELNRPFERMAIRYAGESVLCSQDWRGEVVLGDVRESSLAEIWSGAAYREARARISGQKDAPEGLLCRRCKLAFVE